MTELSDYKRLVERPALETHRRAVAELNRQLARANSIIGWMMPYIGNMAPPSGGLFDLNEHCCENKIPEPGDETKGPSIRQCAAGARPGGVL